MTTEYDDVSAKICIVVPIYKHVALAVEALLSACAQTPEDSLRIIAVVDGDPDPNLARGLQSLQFASKNRCSVFWKKNAGLSAARNTGIDIALSKFGSLESIYFLDADNQLGPNALNNACRKISRDEADIVYPSLNNFGLRGAQDTAGEFSLAALLRGNYVEAGSLVSVRVFRSGLRFNENLRSGYEDWDFWLRAAFAGFRFCHDATLDLRYRKRPESMLAETNRRKSSVIAEIASANQELLSRQGRRYVSARDEPRFAIFHLDRDIVEISDDLECPLETISTEECAKRFHIHQAKPNWTHFPEFLCFSTSSVVTAMRNMHLINGAVWTIITGSQFGVCSIDVGEPGIVRATKDKCVDKSCHLVVVSRKIFADIVYLDQKMILPDEKITFKIGQSGSNSNDVAYESVCRYLELLLKNWRMMDISELHLVPWSWRTPAASRLPIEAVGEFPRADDNRCHIGFVFDAKSGSQEKLLCLARNFHSHGCALHLLSLDDTISVDCLDIFSTINFVGFSRSPERKAQDIAIDDIYFGAEVSGKLSACLAHSAMASFLWLDAIVASDLDYILPLNESSVNKPTILAMLDRSPAQMAPNKKDSDLPYKILAFEHILTLIWCTDLASSVQVSALAVPREKIICGCDEASLSRVVNRVIAARKNRMQADVFSLS